MGVFSLLRRLGFICGSSGLVAICYDGWMYQNKNKKQELEADKRAIRWGVFILSLAIVVALYLLPDTRLYIQWPYAYIKCGWKAPVVTSNLMGGRLYTLPDNYSFTGLAFSSGFYCTEQEAIDNNYQRYH
ncbi:hypothetical protein D9M68_768650 [compost metagenome]